MRSQHTAPEVRFPFGANWRRFVDVIDEDRIRQAEASLDAMLGDGAIAGRSFLDVGCGSGLMSLAALRLGAATVRSFDYDAASVASAERLRDRYAPSAVWTIERGDILNPEYLRTLGTWQIVYSWGVLHHTGRMWEAISNSMRLVADGGVLFIAIYNDQGLRSRYWRAVKRFYNEGAAQRALVIGTHIPAFIVRGLVADLVRRSNPLERYIAYRRGRGMSVVHDWLDWLGGYPFESAVPQAVISRLSSSGFTALRVMTRERTWGCNEYVFAKSATSAALATPNSALRQPR
jgi:2-polyprenyl-3-methyl-5-hydroxy-6-metoxy-1,4-benzoquinol methylase